MSGASIIYCRFLTLLESLQILLRDQYVLAYADYLYSDSALWRINVTYLCSCGEIGNARADEVILRVPLHLHRAAVENDSEPSDDRNIRAGDVIGVLKEVNATCFEYKREEVRRTVCRVSVTQLQLSRRRLISVTDCCTDFCSGQGIRFSCFLLCLCRRLAWPGSCSRSRLGRIHHKRYGSDSRNVLAI